jgi:hypothetical protein
MYLWRLWIEVWNVDKVKTDDCIITAPFHTRRDADQLHVKFVLP